MTDIEIELKPVHFWKPGPKIDPNDSVTWSWRDFATRWSNLDPIDSVAQSCFCGFNGHFNFERLKK